MIANDLNTYYYEGKEGVWIQFDWSQIEVVEVEL